MIPIYWLQAGTLWVGNPTPAFPGNVLVLFDGVNWKTFQAGDLTTYAGRSIGVCVSGDTRTGVIQGTEVAVQVSGIIPSGLYNLGAGNASTVVASTNGLARGNVGQVMGICDSAGSVIIYPTIVGSYANGSRVVGEIAGYPLSTTPLSANQVWAFDGTQLSPTNVLTSGSITGAVTGSGFWHSTSGALDAVASHGTADQLAVTNHAGTDTVWQSINGGAGQDASYANGAWTNLAIHGATVPAAGSLTTGNVLQVSGASALSYGPVNLAGGSNFVTGVLPVGNLPNLAGDVTGAITSNTVGKLLNVSIPSYPIIAGSYVLVYAEGSNSYTWTLTSSIGGGYSAGGDLTGNSAAQYVQSIGGANNTGGTVTLGATVVLTASAGAGGLSLGSWTGATTLPTGNVSWTGASTKTLSLVGASTSTVDGGTLNLGNTNAATIAAGNATNTTAFNLTGNSGSTLTSLIDTYDLKTAASSSLLALNGSNATWYVASVPNADNTLGFGTSSRRWTTVVAANHSVYHIAGDVDPTSSLADGSLQFGPGGASAIDLQIRRNGPHDLTIDNGLNGAAQLEIGGSGATYLQLLSTGTVQIPGNGSSGSSAASLTLTPQAPNASGNSTGGSLVIALSAPSNSGNEAFLQTTRSGSQCTAMGAYSGSFGGWWGKVGIPNTSNWAIISSGSVTQINATSSLLLDINGSSEVELSSTGFFPVSFGGITLGSTSDPWGAAALGASTTSGSGYYLWGTSIGDARNTQQGIIRFDRAFKTVTSGSPGTVSFGSGYIAASTYASFEVNWAARNTSSLAHGGSGKLSGTFTLNAGGTTMTQIGTTTTEYSNVTGGGSPDVVVTLGVSGGGVVVTMTVNEAASTFDFQLDVYVNDN